MFRQVFTIVISAAVMAGCVGVNNSDADKILADAEQRHFAVTHEPRRSSNDAAWEVNVRFGIPECYGYLTYYDDGRVILYAHVPGAGGGQERRQADNPNANMLDPGHFGMCFPKG